MREQNKDRANLPQTGRNGCTDNTHLQGENEKPVYKNICYCPSTHTDKSQCRRTIIPNKYGKAGTQERDLVSRIIMPMRCLGRFVMQNVSIMIENGSGTKLLIVECLRIFRGTILQSNIRNYTTGLLRAYLRVFF